LRGGGSFLTSPPGRDATIERMKTSSLDIMAETKNAIAFRINGKTSGRGLGAVIYLNPKLTRSNAAAVLRSVAEQMDQPMSETDE
jgi:hypothetical protein